MKISEIYTGHSVPKHPMTIMGATDSHGHVSRKKSEKITNPRGYFSHPVPIDEDEDRAVTLSDVATIRTNFPDADFWIARKGSVDSVGKPSKEFNPDNIGIKVTNTEVLLPQYLYYVFEHFWRSGVWRGVATGALKLVSIRTEDVKKISLSSD